MASIDSLTTSEAKGTCGLLIVIVNYKTAGLTIDCLRSLVPEVTGFREGRTRVVVTDNASPDDSVELLRHAVRENGWESWVTIQPLEHNGGFAYGNNGAIRPALESDSPPDFVWLLNPDTIVQPGAMSGLLEFLRKHPEVGMVGSRMEGPDGLPQYSAFRFPSVLGEIEGGMRLGVVSKLLSRWCCAPPIPRSETQCDWVAGASMMIRREVFEAIGLMDEGYFMYFEEVDFCRRARLAGWPCWYVPTARVTHLEGQSSGMTGKERSLKRRPAYWFQARRRYFVQNLGRVPARVADAAWLLAHSSFQVRRALLGRPDPDPPQLMRDFIRHTFLSPGADARSLGQSNTLRLDSGGGPNSA